MKFDLNPFGIGVIGIIAGGILVVTIHCVSTCCKSRLQINNLPNSNQLQDTSRPRLNSSNSLSSSSSTRIDNITTLKFSKECNENDMITCAICLSDFIEGEPIRVLPECYHLFHAPCIDAWLDSQPKCPLCRANIRPPPPPPPPPHIVVTLPDFDGGASSM
ncbi:hypothetical protein ACFE04_001635 [Oxalis oulophora]